MRILVIAALAVGASAASRQARTLHTAKVAEAKTAEFPLLTSQTYGVPASTFLLKESPIQMKTVAYAAPAGVSVKSTPIELKSIKVDEQRAKFKSNKHVGGVLVHQAAVAGYTAGWAAAPVEYTVPASIAEGEIEWKADKVANFQHAPLTYAAQAYAAPAVAASVAYTVPAAAVKTFGVELKAEKVAAIQAAPVAYAAQTYAAPAVAAHVAYAAPASIAVKKVEVDLKAEKVAEVKAAPAAFAAHAYAAPAVAVKAAAPVAYPAAASVGFSVPAPAVTYTAAHPAVIRQEVEIPVTKTVHYADEQVITGYSSSIVKPEISAPTIAAPRTLVGKTVQKPATLTVEKYAAEVKTVNHVAKPYDVPYDVPVPYSVPTPVHTAPVHVKKRVYAAPIRAAPIRAAPIRAAPIRAAPIYAAPIHAGTTYTAPVFAASAAVAAPAVHAVPAPAVAIGGASVGLAAGPAVQFKKAVLSHECATPHECKPKPQFAAVARSAAAGVAYYAAPEVEWEVGASHHPEAYGALKGL